MGMDVSMYLYTALPPSLNVRVSLQVRLAILIPQEEGLALSLVLIQLLSLPGVSESKPLYLTYCLTFLSYLSFHSMWHLLLSSSFWSPSPPSASRPMRDLTPL